MPRQDCNSGPHGPKDTEGVADLRFALRRRSGLAKREARSTARFREQIGGRKPEVGEKSGLSSYAARAVRLRHSRRRAIPRRAATGLPCPPMHDPAYKLLFSDPRMVADLLRGFVPGGWDRWLDFASLAKVSPEYVGDTLARRLGDMLWRVRFRDDAPEAVTGGAGELLVMLEFQSSVDAAMGARLLSAASAWCIRSESAGGRCAVGGGCRRCCPSCSTTGSRGGERRSRCARPSPRWAGCSTGFSRGFATGWLTRGRWRSRMRCRRTGCGRWWGWRTAPRWRSWCGGWGRCSGGSGVRRRANSGRGCTSGRGIRRWCAAARWSSRRGGSWREGRWRRCWKRERGSGSGSGIARAGPKVSNRVEQGVERGIERGMERGRAEERARLYHRLAARKFGAETAQRLSELLGRIPDDGPAAEVGEWIIECETGAELLDRAERASGPPPPERPKNATQSTALRDEGHHRDG